MYSIVELVLKEAGIKPVKRIEFEDWLRGKKFVDVETKKPTPFIMLPVKQRLEIKKQYEQQEAERVESETKRIEEAEKAKREEKKKNNYPEHRDYKWTDSKLNSKAKKWSEDSKKDLGDRYEGAIPDLAESFLFTYQGVKDFLRNKNIKDPYHKEYIADLFV